MATQRRKPCPLALLKAILDDDEVVRSVAGALARLFATYAPGSMDILLRGSWSEDEGIRSDSVMLLAQAAPKDDKVLAVIETAKNDRAFLVRHNAYCAKFKATGKLDEFLAWMIRLQDDEESVLSPIPEDRDLQRRERECRNLVVLGNGQFISEWSDKRPDELAGALLQLLDSKSVVMRRGAIRLIGVASMKVNFADVAKGEFSTKVLDYLYPDTIETPSKPGGRARIEKSRAAVSLENGKVRERLEGISENDADATVRGAARRTLARLASIQK